MKALNDNTYACVIAMATQAFGSFRDARTWANRPFMTSLLTPAEVAETPEGMGLVKAELRRVLERRLADGHAPAVASPPSASSQPDGESREQYRPRGLNQYEL